jgi:hypothetical protein
MSSLEMSRGDVAIEPSRPDWAASLRLSALALTPALVDFTLRDHLPPLALAVIPIVAFVLGYRQARRAAIEIAITPQQNIPPIVAPPLTAPAYSPHEPIVELRQDKDIFDRVSAETLAGAAEDLAGLETFYVFLARQLRAATATTEDAAHAISESVSAADARISELLVAGPALRIKWQLDDRNLPIAGNSKTTNSDDRVPRPSAAPPSIGSFCMMRMPRRSGCSASRFFLRMARDLYCRRKFRSSRRIYPTG